MKTYILAIALIGANAEEAAPVITCEDGKASRDYSDARMFAKDKGGEKGRIPTADELIKKLDKKPLEGLDGKEMWAPVGDNIGAKDYI